MIHSIACFFCQNALYLLQFCKPQGIDEVVAASQRQWRYEGRSRWDGAGLAFRGVGFGMYRWMMVGRGSIGLGWEWGWGGDGPRFWADPVQRR